MRREINKIVELMKFSHSPNISGNFVWIKQSGDIDYLVIDYQTDKMFGINVINSKTNKSIRTNVVWNVEEFLIDLNKEFPNELRKRKIDELI